VTSNPDFKVTIFFNVKQRKNGTREPFSYGNWDFIPNLGSTVAEGTPIKVSCYSWNIEQLLTG